MSRSLHIPFLEASGGPFRLLADESGLFLGQDFFPWMVLAFGAAMVVGNALALLRPPADQARSGAASGRADAGPTERPPVARAVTMIVLGLAAAVWGLASLLA